MKRRFFILLMLLVGLIPAFSQTNNPPLFINSLLTTPDIIAGASITGTLAGRATDTDADPLTYSLASGPAWLNVATNGTLTGSPGLPDVGTNLFTVRVDDPFAAFDTVPLQILVLTNFPPSWTADPITLPAATEDNFYTNTLVPFTTDPEGRPRQFSLISGPSWLQVSLAGSIGGTPFQADVGTTTATVSITDGVNPPIQATVTIPVLNQNDSPVFQFNPINYGGVVATRLFTNSVAGFATDQDGDPLSYSILSGPNWLSMTTNGFISGTPPDGSEGTNTFTLQASDPSGALDVATLNILVGAAPNTPPDFLFDPITFGGQPATLLFTNSVNGFATDADDDSLAYSLVTGPAWLSITTNGFLSGIPPATSQGSNTWILAATDPDGASDTAILNILVAPPPNSQPVWDRNPVTIGPALEDNVFTFNLTNLTFDADNDPLSFGLVSGPAWLRVSPGGAVTGTPLQGDVGTNQFAIAVTDERSPVLQTILVIEVLNVNDPPVFSVLNSATVTEGVPVAGSIASSAIDADGDPLTFSLLSGPAWLTLSPDGAISGTPGAENVGNNTFVFQVEDPLAASDTASFRVEVRPSCTNAALLAQLQPVVQGCKFVGNDLLFDIGNLESNLVYQIEVTNDLLPNLWLRSIEIQFDTPATLNFTNIGNVVTQLEVTSPVTPGSAGSAQMKIDQTGQGIFPRFLRVRLPSACP